ncbi:hypothetical protein ACQJBY_030849 [Aegilops geniculata]
MPCANMKTVFPSCKFLVVCTVKQSNFYFLDTDNPWPEDFAAVQAIMTTFGDASRLRTNTAKSVAYRTSCDGFGKPSYSRLCLTRLPASSRDVKSDISTGLEDWCLLGGDCNCYLFPNHLVNWKQVCAPKMFSRAVGLWWEWFRWADEKR